MSGTLANLSLTSGISTAMFSIYFKKSIGMSIHICEYILMVFWIKPFFFLKPAVRRGICFAMSNGPVERVFWISCFFWQYPFRDSLRSYNGYEFLVSQIYSG